MLRVLIFIFFTLSRADKPAAIDDSASLYKDISLEKLENFGRYDTQNLQGSQSVWVVFQPDCASCESQLKDLDCLPLHIKRIALGVWGTKVNLAKSFRYATSNSLTLVASPRLEKQIDIQRTPTTLLVDENGKVKKRFQERTECQNIKNEMLKNQPIKKETP